MSVCTKVHKVDLWHCDAQMCQQLLAKIHSLMPFLNPTERTFIKGVCFNKNIPTRGGSSIIMAAQRSIITPELSLLSLVTLQCSDGYNKKSYGDQDREIYYNQASHDELPLCLGLFVGA